MIRGIARLFSPRSPARAGTPPPMPVIIGCPRSGTTLLRLMLDSHSDMAIPSETGFLSVADDFAPPGGEALRRKFFETLIDFPPGRTVWRDHKIPGAEFRAALEKINPFSATEGYRLFYKMYSLRHGKKRAGDKTPMYGHHIRAIQAVLPEARFIHIIRDGRDVALSLRKCPFSPGDGMKALAEHWKWHVSAAREGGAHCRNYMEVRYEELVRESERVLKKICSFIELDYQPGMLAYHTRSTARLQEHTDQTRSDGTMHATAAKRLEHHEMVKHPLEESRIHVWKRDMLPVEQSEFEQHAGDLLCELGYLQDRP